MIDKDGMRMRLKTEAFDYEKKAIEKLRHMKVGALFMDMGTGKTRTALELIYLRYAAGKINHIIWLCPCNVIGDLKNGIREHANMDPDLITICGIETLSTSYRANRALYSIAQQKECFLVIDESLKVKNPYALRSRNITRLSEQVKYKLILNGTPISKCEADLFQQFYILDPRILGYQSFWSFAANHLVYSDKYPGKVVRVQNLDYLTDRIAPFTFEVKREDALNNLYPKKHWDRCFGLTDEQREEYERAKCDFLSLQSWDANPDSPIIYRTFNALQQITSGEFIATPAYMQPIQHYPIFDDPIQNPRIQCLLNVLQDYYNRGEKAVIWCQFSREINDISRIVEKEFGIQSALYYGGINRRRRDSEKEKFAGDTQFLIGNKSCAGFGLNLQFCHNEVFYNNDWDWATREQAEDRLHRVGQTEVVNITDIYAINTIDVRILDCVARKENLSDAFKAHMHEKNFMAWLDGMDEGDENFDKVRTIRGAKAE